MPDVAYSQHDVEVGYSYDVHQDYYSISGSAAAGGIGIGLGSSKDKGGGVINGGGGGGTSSGTRSTKFK